MELTFLENDGKWIAEFKVDKEFNLHIEREDGTGKIKMYQNSATGGKYAIVEDFAINNNYKPVLDFSSGYFVGEKSIKIVSEVEPTYAAITTDGDVVEIKSQAKVVEITSNGTTSVEPDAGFSYLTGVTVKTNVPSSGEGEGSSGGGSNYEYLDVRGYDFTESGDPSLQHSYLCYFSALINSSINGAKLIASYGVIEMMAGSSSGLNNALKPNTVAFAIDTKLNMSTPLGSGTAVDLLRNLLPNFNMDYDSIPRITEEQFYNLES